MFPAARRRRNLAVLGGPADVAVATEVALATDGGAFPSPVPLPHPTLWRTTVIVPTHNDGPNMATLLKRLLAEPSVGEVVVVASDCTDGTLAEVAAAARGGLGRVRLFVEKERTGKASAINFALGLARFERIVIVSGDVLPRPGTVEKLVAALDEDGVGLAGGRPVPVNDDSRVMGVAVTLLWELHHRLALHRAKLGEAIAVRAEAIAPLPRTSVDEATFQAVLEQAGWRSAYVPDAIVVNRGPTTPQDFVRQRRQVHAGHIWLRRTYGYTVPSMDQRLLANELWSVLTGDPHRFRPVTMAGTAAAISLEVWSRALARVDYLRRKELHVWNMVESTKAPSLGPNGLDAGGRELVAFPGLATPAPGERGGEHELPVQLHVRDMQRLRAQGRRAQR